MNSRYIKLTSLTWWASFTPFILGVFVATEPLHNLTQWVGVINTLTGGTSPAMLINLGLAGIGLRGSIQ